MHAVWRSVTFFASWIGSGLCNCKNLLTKSFMYFPRTQDDSKDYKQKAEDTRGRLSICLGISDVVICIFIRIIQPVLMGRCHRIGQGPSANDRKNGARFQDGTPGESKRSVSPRNGGKASEATNRRSATTTDQSSGRRGAPRAETSAT